MKCEKCKINPISAHFLGKEICEKCYDKIASLLKFK